LTSQVIHYGKSHSLCEKPSHISLIMEYAECGDMYAEIVQN